MNNISSPNTHKVLEIKLLASSKYFEICCRCPAIAPNEQGLGAVAASQMFGRGSNFQIRTAVSAG